VSGATPDDGLVDVLVVGAGPAGSSLALRLVDAGRSVTLLEASRFEHARVGESLAPAVQDLVQELGVRADVEALGPLPSFGTTSRWGALDESHSHLLHPALEGRHVDRRAFDEALARAAARRGAQLRCGVRGLQAECRGGHWQVRTSDGGAVSARVLVDATGRGSRMARPLGARQMMFDHLVGVGRVWRGAAVHCHVLVETTPQGWWYSAPLPAGGVIALFMTDADLCRAGRLTEPGAQNAALQQAELTAERLAGAAPEGPVRVHPAFSARLRRTDLVPWLAVGDAALAVDPLTGSGVVRALRGAKAAARTVEDLLASPPADHEGILRRYERDLDLTCRRYLYTRLGYYDAGPHVDTPFWLRRRAARDRLVAARR